MVVRKSTYDSKSLYTLNEEDYDFEFDTQYYVNGNLSLLISFEDINLHSYEDINFSKYYYHPNDDVYYNNFRASDFLKMFGVRNFFGSIFQVKNSISFKQNGEWFSFITDAEYVLQPIVDGKYKHVRIFLKNNDNHFYKFKKGNIEFKKINKVFLPKPSVISYDLLDYYLFEGYDFYVKDRYFDITESKKDIRESLKGLDYYFVGTSIYNEARDIDIYVNENDFEEASDRLDNSGFPKIDWTPGHFGHMFEDKYTDAKVDLIVSPYSDYSEVIDENNNADPLLMYFIQTNYYTSICKDELIDLFKMWRFNKLLETSNKLGLHDKNNSYFKNTYVEPERFQKYFDIFSHSKSEEVIINPDNPTIKFSCIKLDEYYYTAIKSKHGTQLITFELPYTISELEVLDDNGVDEVLTKEVDNGTFFRLRFLKDYTLLKFKVDE